MRCRGLHEGCKCRISRGVSFALGCCVLHRIAFPVVSEWYQNCPSFGFYGRGPEESKIRSVASLSPMRVGKYRGAGKGSAEPQSVGLSGRAAPLIPSVHDLGSEVAGVEVGHEATNLAAFFLQNAHAVVGTTQGRVRTALTRPLQRRPSSVAKTFRNSDLISPKVLR